MGEDRTPTGRRVTVPQAAEVLGVSVEAVRGRIKRGTLDSEKVGSTVYVYLAGDQSRPDTDQTTDQSQPDTNTLISEMRSHLEDLRTQLEAERQAHSEARRLLAAALERIPPALEPPESAESPGPNQGFRPRS